MRKPIIAANWKMNAPPQGWDIEDSPFEAHKNIDVVVFPSLLDLHSCLEKFMIVGAQYGRPEPTGAFTGDVSMQLLAIHGCRYVLCGHSERRIHHAESDTFIAKQVEAALIAGLIPILCVGETADERESGQTKEVIQQQLQASVLHPPAAGDQKPEAYNSQVIIAYEPVWAIGTGKTATPDDVQEMHSFIRSLLPPSVRQEIRIVYGGSVKPQNAPDLIAQPDIDGFLVGTCSLNTADFKIIVEACVQPA